MAINYDIITCYPFRYSYNVQMAKHQNIVYTMCYFVHQSKLIDLQQYQLLHLKIVDGRKNKENNIVKGYIGRLVIDILMHLVLERNASYTETRREEKEGEK